MKSEPVRKKDVIGMLAIAAIAAAFYFGGDDSTKPAPMPPVVLDATMPALIAAYNANAIAFDAAYKGKRLRFHGTVSSVAGASYAPVLIVAEPGVDPYPADFDDGEDLSKLRPGDAVTFTCGGFDAPAMLDGCRLVTHR